VFRYLGRVDRTFVRLNFAWLLIIVATPFLTEIIREGELDVARFGLYALAQALLLIVFGLMQTVAGRRGLFVPGTPPEIVGQAGRTRSSAREGSSCRSRSTPCWARGRSRSGRWCRTCRSWSPRWGGGPAGAQPVRDACALA